MTFKRRSAGRRLSTAAAISTAETRSQGALLRHVAHRNLGRRQLARPVDIVGKAADRPVDIGIVEGSLRCHPRHDVDRRAICRLAVSLLSIPRLPVAGLPVDRSAMYRLAIILLSISGIPVSGLRIDRLAVSQIKS